MFKHLVNVTINNIKVYINASMSVLEACKYIGFQVARFCYHSMLSVAGNCRMCLVELTGSIKPIVSCALPITNGMVIYLDSPLVQKARENVLEALLLNHPLDCPICDQGGECDLQDQSKKFGTDRSRSFFVRRVVADKYISPLILTIMTRCIHCTRCIRFSAEVLGTEVLGMLNRGGRSEIGNYSNNLLLSELSGNVVDLCPVGALTSKQYNFRARPWELRSVESVDLSDSLGSNVFFNFQFSNIIRVVPKFNRDINGSVISDSARFFIDSLASRRLYRSYYCNNDRTNRSFYLDKSLNRISLNKESLLLVDDCLDLESYVILMNLTYRYGSYVNSIRLSGQPYSNYYAFDNRFKVNTLSQSSGVILIIGCNIKIESSIINYKLRLKHSNENSAIYNLGGYNERGFLSFFINLSTTAILKSAEGKNRIISKLLFKETLTHIIAGESLYNRGVSFLLLKKLISEISPSAILLNIAAKCNTAGSCLVPLKSISKKIVSLSKKGMVRISVNLNETIFLYRLLSVGEYYGMWLDTHGPTYLGKFSDRLVPLMPSVFCKGYYINLEKRVQKLSEITFKSQFASKLLNVREMFFKTLLGQGKVALYLTILTAMAKESSIFESNRLLFHNSCKGALFERVSTYPVKNYIEDSIFSSKMTMFSKSLTLKSVSLRNTFNNFY